MKVNPDSKTAVEESFNEYESMHQADKNTDTVDNTTNTTPIAIREARDRLKANAMHSAPGSTFMSNPPLTASARISALNIVGDLLRKVGVSEIVLLNFFKNIFT